MSGQMDFDTAVNIVNEHKTLSVSNDTKLMLYGYFKVGNGTAVPQNAPFSTVGILKHKQWREYSEKYTKEEAQKRYIGLVKVLLSKQEADNSENELSRRNSV